MNIWTITLNMKPTRRYSESLSGPLTCTKKAQQWKHVSGFIFLCLSEATSAGPAPGPLSFHSANTPVPDWLIPGRFLRISSSCHSPLRCHKQCGNQAPFLWCLPEQPSFSLCLSVACIFTWRLPLVFSADRKLPASRKVFGFTHLPRLTYLSTPTITCKTLI